MRQFFIMNDLDERLSLQESERFFTAPGGMGYAYDVEYSNSTNGFFAQTSNQKEQPEITGDIILSDKPYVQRERIVRFLKRSKELTLLYIPHPDIRLFMDVDVISLELTEIATFGAMEVPITIRGKTPWHEKDDITYTLVSGAEAENAMRFPFSFPFSFTRGEAEASQTVTVTGDFPASVEAYIHGPLIAPVFKAVDKKTGKEIGKLDLTGVSIRAGEHIRFNTTPHAERIEKVYNKQPTDLVDSLDLNNNNFFRLPIGTPIELSISAEIPAEAGAISHTVNVRQYMDY